MGFYTGTTRGGIVIDRTWLENDGLVNVVSAKAPTGEPAREVTPEEEANENTVYLPGVWNVFPVRRGFHGTPIGMNAPAEDTLSFYTVLLARVDTGK